MKKEIIPSDPDQSFRFFSWKDSLDNLLLRRSGSNFALKEGMGNVWHYHPEVEITLFTKGVGIHYIGDDVSSFKAPDLFMIGSNLPHHWTCESSSGYCIQFSLAPTSPLAALHELGHLKAFIEKSRKGLKFSARCREDVLSLIERCLSCAPLERLSIFLKILDRLSNSRSNPISTFTPQGLSETKSEVVKKAVQYILENARNEDLELQQVLDHVTMSRPTFSRHFQQTLGQSYTQFVQAVRLETARNYLVNTDKAITEIAYASGFSNLSHFNSLFKKRWSLSPRELRSLMRSTS